MMDDDERMQGESYTVKGKGRSELRVPLAELRINSMTESNMEPSEPLPPRDTSRRMSKTKKESPSSLQTLLSMGFPRARAEKSLVVTGDRGVQVASDWLLSHVHDPRLDDPSPRKFLLYLVPRGELEDRLQTFWDGTRTQIGRNGVHECFPHVTLVNPFSVPYHKVHHLRFILGKFKFPVDKDTPQESLLRNWVQDIQIILKDKLDLHVTPIPNGFHVSLAYQFATKHFSALEDLLSAVDLENVPVDISSWELRIYSYDPKALNADTGVYKVNYPLVPREEDELPLLSGDYVYIAHADYAASTDGWVPGVSWLTGCSGYLPKNYVQKTQDSNSWTLHSSIKLLDTLQDNEEEENENKESSSSSVEPIQIPSQPRQVYIVRHGERVDFTFGSWIPFCFDASGRYSRKDLNMPRSLPIRSKGPEGFTRDCPLTCLGETQAKLTGEAMQLGGVSIHHSPGLFEWLAWYQDGSMPDWMTKDELVEAGFNIDLSYKPYISEDELQDTQESAENFYVLAHAPTLDACSRQLVGGEARTVSEMMNIIKKVSYCGVALVTQIPSPSESQTPKWKLDKPNFPPMTHYESHTFKKAKWKSNEQSHFSIDQGINDDTG
ncbi:UBASH3 [Lepeophtheirus salmonis]|uniref:Ecdysteroid-phosphate phosphatase n=1 Tax=Lepeophtheirus salmonis TaxID=72036 RepID=A0A7R8CDX9_LEPSM|nr:UBASH3 [Lepeophtheirus salmonis]CAF2779779.1 UBASH3 [Lepeophtheirus salmonis]